jgi:hypothetical protein
MATNAELSSASSRLNELIDRIAEIAGGLGPADRDDIGSELFEIDRTLRAAKRRLERLLDH